MGGWLRVQRYAESAVDGASLAFFRFSFCLVLAWEVGGYLVGGRGAAIWNSPTFHFTYYGFGWVAPWAGNGIVVHLTLLTLLAVLAAIGVATWVTLPLTWVGFTYLFLLDQTTYLNHYYAAILFTFLLAALPGTRTYSLDRLLRKPTPNAPYRFPGLWEVWTLRFQVGVIYVFAGIAKVQSDWLTAAPWTSWVQARQALPFVRMLADTDTAWLVFGLGGLAVDLLVVPALLWRRTRFVAFVVVCCFHFLNKQLFDIGMFPVMMVLATTIFFEPDWPVRITEDLTGIAFRRNARLRVPLGRWARLAVLCYCVAQLTIPLRHWLYPGDVSWTEEGHRFSWRMMLRSKVGSASFRLVHGVDTATVDPSLHLTQRQVRAMSTRPDMILHVLRPAGPTAAGTRLRCVR